MAIGTTFDTLQAAILAEADQKLRETDSFRRYLLAQNANRNQSRQVGVNEYDAETRRGLGYRNADEQAADREARYGYLDRELVARDRQFASNLESLREQLRQKAAADDEANRLKAELEYLKVGQLESAQAQNAALAKDQIGIQKSYYESLANPRQSEAFTASAIPLIAAEEDKERRGGMVADLLNSKTRSKTGWFTGVDSAREAAFQEVANGPLSKDLSLVKFDQGLGRYVPAVSASKLREALLMRNNPNPRNQSITIEPPKPAGADYVAEIVNGKYVLKGANGGYVNMPATPGGSADMRTTEWIPPTREDAASVDRMVNGGAPTDVNPDAYQLLQSGHTPESYRQALSQEFRRRLAELESTPSGTAPLLAPLYSDIARRRSVEPTRIGQSTMFRTPQAQIRDMANSQEIAAWEAGLSPEDWRSLFSSAIAESYRNPTRGYDNFVYGQ